MRVPVPGGVKDGNQSAARDAGQADSRRRRRGDDPHAARGHARRTRLHRRRRSRAHVPRPIPVPLSVDNTMRASLHITALTALTLIASSALAIAAEVRVLTVGSTQVAAKAIAADFEK